MSVSTKKRTQENGPIYFKAYKTDEWRQLSNLFGPVEWGYQKQKFREGCDVHVFLAEGERRELEEGWTFDDFERTCKAFQHKKVETYVVTNNDGTGYVASGLLAQMTSQIVRNPTSLLARHRLTYIKGLDKLISEDEIKAWHKENVNPELNEEQISEVMFDLLLKKYEIPKYRELLLSTGDRELHEGKGRGVPNLWEYQMQELKPEEIAKGYTRGGDLLGKLLTSVRRQLHKGARASDE